MHTDVESLLDSLARHGTIDSTGSFTLNLGRAQELLPRFQSSNPASYLLQLISFAVSQGVSRITLRSLRRGFNVVLHGLSVPLDELKRTLLLDPNCLPDLGLSLTRALKSGLRQIVVTNWGTQSYRHSLPADRTATLAAQKAPALEIQFVRAGWFQLSGLGPNQPELELLGKHAIWSRTPILLDNKEVGLQYGLGSSAFVIAVGQVDLDRFVRPPDLIVPEMPWSGFLGFRYGHLDFVVDGVERGRISSLDFDGVVYHPGVRLDASREQLVYGTVVQELLQDLETIKVLAWKVMLEWLITDKDPDPWYYHSVFQACILGYLEVDKQLQLSRWMAEQLGEVSPQRKAWSLQENLLQQRLALSTQNPSHRFQLELVDLLLICDSSLAGYLERQEPLLRAITDFLAQNHPSLVLVRGYLLLALGALYEESGNRSSRLQVWEEAVGLCEGSREGELLKAHMDYPMAHIKEEARKALSMEIDDQLTASDPWS